MADIFQDELLSTEQGDIENLFASGEVVEDEEKVEKEEESTEQKEITHEAEVDSVKVSNPEPKIPTLEELADSDFIRNRQMAAKSIVEYLHQAGSNKDALHSVISVMCRLLEDEDILVRSELMEHIPSIALFCKERSEDLGVVIRQQIVPYTVKLITDALIPVRRIGRTTLLVLLENNIIDSSHLTEWICPLVAQLATSEDNPEDVSVMCKMIPYVGKELTEKFFLEPFLALCCDMSSSSREVCLMHFGNVCKVVGRETTESMMLPVFYDLCKDETLVTKTNKIQCVDIAVDLASIVSSTTREGILTRVYSDLLCDKSHNVERAAHLSLGRFISTFADPSKTGLCYKDGIWTDIPFEDNFIEDHQFSVNYFENLAPQITSSAQFLDELSVSKIHILNYCSMYNDISKKALDTKLNDENSNINVPLTSIQRKPNSERKYNNSVLILKKELHVDNENHVYNNFQFWRTPLPEIELDSSLVESKSENTVTKTSNEKSKFHNSSVEWLRKKKTYSSADVNFTVNHNSSKSLAKRKKTIFLENQAKPAQHEESSVNAFQTLNSSESAICFSKQFFTQTERRGVDYSFINKNTAPLEEEDCRKAIYDQNIVPPDLLLKYTEISEYDVQRSSHAYCFPSVAYTLGRKHWSCLRSMFHSLSSDIEPYNVKKPIAASLHELALILGRDITKRDLFPVFEEMVTDEELCPIVIKHVSTFLKVLWPSDRKPFLRLLKEICTWELEEVFQPSNDWRFRLTIVQELIPCVDLFTSCEALHFFSISLKLLQDKICAVRKSAVELLAVSLSSIVTNPKSSEFIKAGLIALDEKYRKSNKWLWRQLYVFICQEIAIKKSLPTDLYVNEIVPNLFSLTWDPVPNVRIAVARCISLTLLPLDFLPSIQRTHYQLLLQVMYSLQSDTDRDVRHLAHLSAAAFNVLPPNKVSPA